MNHVSRYLLLARFFWLVGLLTAYVWVLRRIGAKKELATTRSWFLAMLDDAGLLRTMQTDAKKRLH
jgi:hypothetical protein